MDIVAVGRAPFRIVELMNAMQYDDGMLLEGTVDYLDDRERSVDAKKRRELIELFRFATPSFTEITRATYKAWRRTNCRTRSRARFRWI